MTDFASEREAMVERQMKRRGITEPEILDAFRQVPRELFVSPAYAHLAYEDHPLPIDLTHELIPFVSNRAESGLGVCKDACRGGGYATIATHA